MKTKLPLLLAVLLPLAAHAADDLSTALQKGLFEEEANQNLPAAIQAYQSLLAASDDQRKLAATALFRLGECYRKLGKTNDAVAQYQRLIRDFTDQTNLLTLCRQNLRGLDAPLTSTTAGTSYSERFQAIVDRAAGQAVSDQEESEIRRIRALIQDSPDLINSPAISGGLTPLQAAANSGYARVVRFLIESGADVNSKSGLNNSAQTALHLAAQAGHKAVIELLLSAKADVAVRTSAGTTPLHYAAGRGFRQVAEQLLAAGAPVNALDDSGLTPLHRAVMFGHQAVAELLFAKGANLNLPATEKWSNNSSQPEIQKGDTPLHTAVRTGHERLVEWLALNGADLNAAPGSGRATPLYVAASLNKADIIQALLRTSANPARTNATRASAGVDFEATDSSGETALWLAVAYGKLNAASALLDAGANPNVIVGEGHPLLHAAANTEEMLRRVLARKPDLDVTNLHGRTALMSLMQENRALTNLLQPLLAAGANPNLADNTSWTPLHVAAANALLEVAALLILHGADVNAVNNQGATPLTYARSYGSNRRTPARVSETVALLLRSGADDTLPRRNVIGVSRRSRDFTQNIFYKGTNDFNRHSLYELISAAFTPYGSPPSLPFPDLAQVEINRLAGGGKTTNFVIHLAALVATNTCTNDLWLEWGDMVEFPETEHPLPAQWAGFEEVFATPLAACLCRRVEIKIKGRTNRLDLKTAAFPQVVPPGNSLADAAKPNRGWKFNADTLRLKDVLNNTGLLLTSSDLSRVRVRRLDPVTREPREWTLDETKVNAVTDFWLRDGDVIEVPDLPPGGRVTAEGPQPPAGQPLRTLPSRSLREPVGALPSRVPLPPPAPPQP